MSKIGFKQTEISEIPETWEVARLVEVTEKIGSGATPKGGKESYGVTGLSLIRSQNVLNEGFSRSGLAFIDEKQAKELDNVTLISKDVLLNITGDSVARSCMVPDNVLPARVNQHVLIIRTKKDKLHPLWLRYFLIEPKTQQRLFSLASSGATRQALTKGMIEGLLIPFPSLTEQENLTKILFDIDVKIELNHQMNKTLESIAQALFKEWFVDFEFPGYEKTKFVDGLPGGWYEGKLIDISEIVMGQSPPGETYNESGDGAVFYQGNRDFGVRFPTPRVYSTAPTRMAEAGDVLISVRAPVGALNITLERCAIGRGVAALRMKRYSNGFLFYFLLTQNDLWSRYNSEGTVFGCLNKTEFQKMQVTIPSDEIMAQFDKIITSVEKKIRSNEEEIRVLTKICDYLLPMLMSGRVRFT